MNQQQQKQQQQQQQSQKQQPKIINTSMASTRSLIILFSAICLCGVLSFAPEQVAANMNMIEQVDNSKPSVTVALIENPEIVARVLDNLLRSIIYSASIDSQTSQSTQKRGLDLGISRGFSGSQAGKHLMGLSAASFANGPGKR